MVALTLDCGCTSVKFSQSFFLHIFSTAITACVDDWSCRENSVTVREDSIAGTFVLQGGRIVLQLRPCCSEGE